MTIDADERAQDRCAIFMAGGAPSQDAGSIYLDASSLGTLEEWEWSAFFYCLAMIGGVPDAETGGKVEVSVAALGILLNFVARLTAEREMILHPQGAA